jgi:hypothetical protein
MVIQNLHLPLDKRKQNMTQVQVDALNEKWREKCEAGMADTPEGCLQSAADALAESMEVNGLPVSRPLVEVKPHEVNGTYTVQEIEERTRGQSANAEWLKCRMGRVTASVARRVVDAMKSNPVRRDTLMKKIASDIMNTNDIRNLPAIKWGAEHESTAVNQYATTLPHHSRLDVQCGLHVHPKYPFVGASPDGIVYIFDSVYYDDEGRAQWTVNPTKAILLEVKCPYSLRDVKDLDELAANQSFYLKRNPGTLEWELNMHGKGRNQARTYYYQMQMGMACTDTHEAELYVWTPNCQVKVKVPRQTPAEERGMLEGAEYLWDNYLKPHFLANPEFRAVQSNVEVTITPPPPAAAAAAEKENDVRPVPKKRKVQKRKADQEEEEEETPPAKRKLEWDNVREKVKEMVENFTSSMFEVLAQ